MACNAESEPGVDGTKNALLNLNFVKQNYITKTQRGFLQTAVATSKKY